jgi:hypothetical protein
MIGGSNKVQCSKIKPCQSCMKAILSKKQPVCIRTMECLVFPLLEANVFTQTLFTFPSLDFDSIDQKRHPGALDTLEKHYGSTIDLKKFRYIVTHEDFQCDLTSDNCDRLLSAIGSRLDDVASKLNLKNLPDQALSTVIPLIDSSFGGNFRHDICSLLGHYREDSFRPGPRTTQFQAEKQYFAVERFAENANKWYIAGTRLLESLQGALQYDLLTKCDIQRGSLLILYILYTMLIVGKARCSPLANSLVGSTGLQRVLANLLSYSQMTHSKRISTHSCDRLVAH